MTPNFMNAIHMSLPESVVKIEVAPLHKICNQNQIKVLKNTFYKLSMFIFLITPNFINTIHMSLPEPVVKVEVTPLKKNL